MQESNFQRFRDLMRGMGRIFNSEPDELVLDVYWLALRSWQINDFQTAVAHLMATAKFMPRPADFTNLRNAGELTGGEAWERAVKGSPNWRRAEDLPTGRVARAAAIVGGFRAIAMADIEFDLPHIQRRFLEAYNQLSEVEPVREALPQIVAKAVENFGKTSHQLPAPSPEKGGNLTESKTFTSATLIENRA